MISVAETSQISSRPSDVHNEPGALSNITIDCVVFSFIQGRLKVLTLDKTTDDLSARIFPGGWVLHNENIDDAALRQVGGVVGEGQFYLEQLKAFGAVIGDQQKRLVTIAYYALIREEDCTDLISRDGESRLHWRSLEGIGELPDEQQKILQYAIKSLQHKVKHEPVGFHLLPKKFTLLQLQELYEAVLSIKLDKPNFRRKMMKMKLLIPCGEKQQNVAHRAAELYRYDEEVYSELQQKGFEFEL